MQNEINKKMIFSWVSILVIIIVIIFSFWYFGNKKESDTEGIINDRISTSTEEIDFDKQNTYQNSTSTTPKTPVENNFDYKG